MVSRWEANNSVLSSSALSWTLRLLTQTWPPLLLSEGPLGICDFFPLIAQVEPLAANGKKQHPAPGIFCREPRSKPFSVQSLPISSQDAEVSPHVPERCAA